MATYLITYDLNKETVRPKITKAIKEYDSWAMLSESSYAVVSAASPKEVYEGLSEFLDNNDQLYVITLESPYYGQGSEEVNEWLANNL